MLGSCYSHTHHWTDLDSCKLVPTHIESDRRRNCDSIIALVVHTATAESPLHINKSIRRGCKHWISIMKASLGGRGVMGGYAFTLCALQLYFQKGNDEEHSHDMSGRPTQGRVMSETGPDT